ncbi:MAG: XapX domain-containing protein [Halanaerobiaceae bacterium]
MKELILALLTGFFVGVIFSFLRLPIPIPKALPGVVGIIGIFPGYYIVKLFY